MSEALTEQTGVITPVVQENKEVVPTQGPSLAEKIANIERELAGYTKVPESTKVSSSTYTDEYGNPTFFVKNISGTHVLITDITRPGAAIQEAQSIRQIDKGISVDLLKIAGSMEALQRSRDLASALGANGEKPLLKRLTQVEFLEERAKELETKRKIEAMQMQQQYQQPQQPQQPYQQQQQFPQPQQSLNSMYPHERPTMVTSVNKIRAAVEARLGKFALKNEMDPNVRNKALPEPEFIDWINSESLTSQEIDYILRDPSVSDAHNVRASLLQKKATIK